MLIINMPKFKKNFDVNLVHDKAKRKEVSVSCLMKTRRHMLDAGKILAVTATTKGVKMGLNMIHAGLGPISMIASPLIALHTVIKRNSLMNKLYYLKKRSSECRCRSCDDALNFLISKNEARSSKDGIKGTVVGAPFVTIYDLTRSSYKIWKGTKGADRKKHAENLIKGASPSGYKNPKGDIVVQKAGCAIAQQTIAILFKEPKDHIITIEEAYPKTIAAINAIDGWSQVKNVMNP